MSDLSSDDEGPLQLDQLKQSLSLNTVTSLSSSSEDEEDRFEPVVWKPEEERDAT
jgi:hypothetical protein